MSLQETRPRFAVDGSDGGRADEGETPEVKGTVYVRCGAEGCDFTDPRAATVGAHRRMAHGIVGPSASRPGRAKAAKRASDARKKGGGAMALTPSTHGTPTSSESEPSGRGRISREMDALLTLAELTDVERGRVFELARARWGI